MEFFSRIQEASVNLFSAKLRSFLAILGVLVGTASVVALISSSQLATEHALEQFKALGTNLLSLSISAQQQANEKPGQAKQFQLSDIPNLKRASSQIVLVAPYTTLYQSMYFKEKALNGQVIGATDVFSKIAKIKMAHGRFVSYLDEHNFYCVLGAKLALTIRKMNINPMLKQMRIGKDIFTIIGVMKSLPPNLFISADLDRSVIIPLKTSYIVNKNTHINDILLRLVQHPDIASAKANVTHKMKEMLPKKRINFMSPEQIILLYTKQKETGSLLLIAIGSISLVVGGIGVMNIMLVSVLERRREIGIRMAIGARQLDILRMFLIESILLTIFGGILGIIVGVLASYILTVLSHWQFYLYWGAVALGFIVSMLVGILSGFYPAWRASKMDPIQALKA